MRQGPLPIRRFGHDTRGSVATTFGLAAIPVLLMTGAAIDYSRAATQLSNLQQATDATVLAIAHTYLKPGVSQDSVQNFAQSYISGMMNGATVKVADLPADYGSVCMTSTLAVPTMLMTIANIKTMSVTARACSQVPSSSPTFEVALALDNSGSMANAGSDNKTKISALIAAAKQLVSTLIPAGTTNPTANIALVPFTAMVNANVNLKNPGTTPTFMDTTAVSSIHWQNFQRPVGATFQPQTKFDLFSALTNQSWGGCVEERPYPVMTTDTAATTSNGDSMFVPYFAPDEPGYNDGTYYSGYTCYQGFPFYPYCLNKYYNSYLQDYGASSTSTGNCSSVNQTADNLSTNIFPGSSMTMVCKYKGASVSTATSSAGPKVGPNFMCTAQKLTPLTDKTSDLTSAINAMTANGSTNLASGFMWAWRAISPTVNPFPTTNPTATIGYHAPQAYGSTSNKVIILLTDGMNSFGVNTADGYFKSLYGGFGYYANNRMAQYMTNSSWSYGSCSSYSSTDDISRCQLDNVTLEACAHAKAQNITVYTIGVSVPGGDVIDDRGLSLLQTCATNTNDFFQVSDTSSLNSAFQQIASSISNLRLSQ